MYVAYIRVSTITQDCNNQKMAIYDYAHKNGITISKFIEVQASTKQSQEERRTNLLLELKADDTIIVSELSRLGRSVIEVVKLTNELVKRKIGLIALKENLIINGELTIQSKMIITLFSLFAEIERDLISQRTKEALAAIKKNKKIGRPMGSLSKSKLGDKEDQVRKLLQLKISASAMARIFGVSRHTVKAFVERLQQNNNK